jgi:hypothetical protein
MVRLKLANRHSFVTQLMEWPRAPCGYAKLCCWNMPSIGRD